MNDGSVEPFRPTEEDIAAETSRKRKVKPVKKNDRIHSLNEDVIWALETDLSAFRELLTNRRGPLTDKEHARLIRTAEQLRKMRMTDATIARDTDPAGMDDLEIDDEFEERCQAEGLDPAAILRVFGITE